MITEDFLKQGTKNTLQETGLSPTLCIRGSFSLHNLAVHPLSVIKRISEELHIKLLEIHHVKPLETHITLTTALKLLFELVPKMQRLSLPAGS